MDRYGPAVLRLMVGVTFVAHGAQKLFGVWGGGGLAGTAAYFESLGLSPGYPLAVAVAVAETLGGALLVAGGLTSYAAAALIVTSLGAIWNVHLTNGFFMNWGLRPGRGKSVEHNPVLLVSPSSIFITGPSALSVEHRRARSAESYRAGRARLRWKH